MQDGFEDCAARLAAEGKDAGGHFVEHRTEGEKIGAGVHCFSADLLGRHVGDGADGGAGAGELFFGHGGRGVVACHRGAGHAAALCRLLRQAEIEDLRVPVRGDENIGRLDVAVNDALGMRRFEPFGDLDAQFEQQIERKRLAVDAVLERFAFEALHREERLAFVLADFVDGANVGVIEGRSGARFALESLQRLVVLRQFLGQEFQRDEAAELDVFRLVHHTHPAAAEFFNDLIVRDRFADHGRGA